MYTSIWNKYLPVLKIILKRAVTSDQVLKLDATDFERAGLIRKTNTKFNIQSAGGKFPGSIKFDPAAKDFVSILLQDASAKDTLQQNDFSFILTSKYELTIRLVPKKEDAVTE